MSEITVRLTPLEIIERGEGLEREAAANKLLDDEPYWIEIEPTPGNPVNGMQMLTWFLFSFIPAITLFIGCLYLLFCRSGGGK